MSPTSISLGHKLRHSTNWILICTRYVSLKPSDATYTRDYEDVKQLLPLPPAEHTPSNPLIISPAYPTRAGEMPL